MNIRVADAAVGDGNEHVMSPDFTPLERERLQGGLGGHCGIALGRQHDVCSLWKGLI